MVKSVLKGDADKIKNNSTFYFNDLEAGNNTGKYGDYACMNEYVRLCDPPLRPNGKIYFYP